MAREHTLLPRMTRQKQAIRTAFVDADRPLSPEEAFSAAKDSVEGLSLATVYRNLKAMVADKALVPVEIPGESTRYEIAGKAHHHHFQCNTCGKLFELAGCEIEFKPKLPRGFKASGHEFFVYGECVDCR